MYAHDPVHWPVLITWLVVPERTSVGLLAGAGVIVLTLILARVVAAVFEDSLRWLPRTRPTPAISAA